MSILSIKDETSENLQVLKEFEEASFVKVFAVTKEQAKTLSAEIAEVYENAFGKGGVQRKGHDAYQDSDLFSAQGIKTVLEAGERLIAVAQTEEAGTGVIVGAIVADRLSPYHVAFTSMAVPTKRRGNKLGSHLVRGLTDIIEADKFTVNCTELTTHNIAAQAAHFHNGFRAICGFGFCHYSHVFFKNHRESVLLVVRLQGKILPNLRRFRAALGRQLGRHLLDVKQKLIAYQASGQVILASGRLDDESLNLLSEVLKERTAYVPKRYHDLVQSILFQFEDVLDVKVKSWVRPEAREPEPDTQSYAGKSAGADHNHVMQAKKTPGKDSEKDAGKHFDSLSIDYKEGLDHSYVNFNKDFVFDETELAKALKAIHKIEKRYIKVCVPANTPEALKAADCLIDQGFVFHSYVPLGRCAEQVQPIEDASDSDVKAPEFYDVLCLQWITPALIKDNPMPGETESVIKLYGYPENLSGQLVKTIGQDTQAIKD